MSPSPFLRLPLIACCWLLAALALPAHAAVEDKAGFFSTSARNEANRRIAEMQRVYKKDLLIETLPTLPPEVQKSINLEGQSNLGKVFQEWSIRQARTRDVNGIYVLIVKSPAHLQAVVGNDTARRAFTNSDRDALVSLMLAKMRQKQYDAALIDGVGYVTSTLRSHSPGAAGAPVTSGSREVQRSNSGGFGWLIPLLLIGGVVWVVLGLIRSFMNRGSGNTIYPPGGGQYGQTPYGQGYPQGGYNQGGGGFMRSLLGGMLGAGAGMWMYNNVFGGGTSAHGAGTDDRYSGGESRGDQGFTGQDTDYSSSGGDFSDSSGGGGGGDFGGGGDSGGGGDF